MGIYKTPTLAKSPTKNTQALPTQTVDRHHHALLQNSLGHACPTLILPISTLWFLLEEAGDSSHEAGIGRVPDKAWGPGGKEVGDQESFPGNGGSEAMDIVLPLNGSSKPVACFIGPSDFIYKLQVQR